MPESELCEYVHSDEEEPEYSLFFCTRNRLYNRVFSYIQFTTSC